MRRPPAAAPLKGGGAAPPPFVGSYYAGAAADATGVAVAAAGARDGAQIIDFSKVLHDGSFLSLSYSNTVDKKTPPSQMLPAKR